MLLGEGTHTNFLVFGSMLLGREPMIYHIRGEYANHLKPLMRFTDMLLQCKLLMLMYSGGRCGRDRMVVVFISTYAISAYHH